MKNTIIRVTKAQKLTAIKGFIPEDAHLTFSGDPEKNKLPYEFDYNEIIAFLDNELDLLARKNTANGEKKLTDTQKENEEFKALIIDYLAALPEENNSKTCSDIINNIPQLNGLKTQRVSPILTALREEKIVGTTKGKKGATLFHLL